MQRKGYKQPTIRGAVNSLKSVDRRVNVLTPENTLRYLTTIMVSEARKENLSNHLEGFYKWKGIAFEKPRYTRIMKLPFIPTENEVDQLIGGVGKKTAPFFNS